MIPRRRDGNEAQAGPDPEAHAGDRVVRGFQPEQERLTGRQNFEGRVTRAPEVHFIEIGPAREEAIPRNQYWRSRPASSKESRVPARPQHFTPRDDLEVRPLAVPGLLAAMFSKWRSSRQSGQIQLVVLELGVCPNSLRRSCGLARTSPTAEDRLGRSSSRASPSSQARRLSLDGRIEPHGEARGGLE